MADASIDVKPCIKCGANDRYANGRCKACRKTYNAEWNAANPEKLAAHAKKNKVRHAALTKVWQENNRERFMSACAAYRAENREKCNAAIAKWAKKNPAAKNLNTINRRAKKRMNGGTLSKGLVEKLFKLQNGKCPCCGQQLGNDSELDHVMPIARGGINDDRNMQLLRRKCNREKHAKDPIDFMQSRGFLL